VNGKMGCGQPKNSLKEAMKSFSQILMVTSQSGISFGISIINEELLPLTPLTAMLTKVC
jgi:hypothetical protein